MTEFGSLQTRTAGAEAGPLAEFCSISAQSWCLAINKLLIDQGGSQWLY